MDRVVGGSSGGILDQEPGQQWLERAGESGRRRWIVQDRGQDRHRVAVGEGCVALDGCVQRGAERPEVRSGAGCLAADELRCHVGGGADHDLRVVPAERMAAVDGGDAEVDEDQPTVLADRSTSRAAGAASVHLRCTDG
jgi:hypothetical protein